MMENQTDSKFDTIRNTKMRKSTLDGFKTKNTFEMSPRAETILENYKKSLN